MTTTQEYASDLLADVHGDGAAGVVLLWHGRGARSRPALAGLASTIAEHGHRVVVPDWDWQDADGGRSALLASLSLARDVAEDAGVDPATVVLAGWSLGGTAALGLVASTDEPVSRVVLLAPGDGAGALVPFTGLPLPETFPERADGLPVHVVVPVADDVVPPALVRGLRSRLAASGWQTTSTDVEADHWSVAMTRFDTEADRPVPAQDDAAMTVGRQVAAIIAGGAGAVRA